MVQGDYSMIRTFHYHEMPGQYMARLDDGPRYYVLWSRDEGPYEALRELMARHLRHRAEPGGPVLRTAWSRKHGWLTLGGQQDEAKRA